MQTEHNGSPRNAMSLLSPCCAQDLQLPCTPDCLLQVFIPKRIVEPPEAFIPSAKASVAAETKFSFLLLKVVASVFPHAFYKPIPHELLNQWESAPESVAINSKNNSLIHGQLINISIPQVRAVN